MTNQRTHQLRRRQRRAYFGAVITLVVAVGGIRIVELGYRGDKLLLVILVAAVAALLFLFFADRVFAYHSELKHLALIDNQRVHGGGREFVGADEARGQVGTDHNIWGQ